MKENNNSLYIFCLNVGIFLTVLALDGLIGAWSINYPLQMFFHFTIPAWKAFVISLVIGEITIPFALILFVVHLF